MVSECHEWISGNHIWLISALFIQVIADVENVILFELVKKL